MGELRLRDSQQFGLTAGNFAVELRVAEKRRSHPLVAHLGGFALREKFLVAHVTTAARDLERDDDPVADPKIARLGADLSDNAHGLVAEDVPGFHERPENLVEVQIGPANVRRGDFDNGIGGLLDLRVGHRLHAHIALAVPGDSLHAHS